MSIENNVILVTGALGWLGRNLIHGLATGIPGCDFFKKPDKHQKVRAFDRKGLNFDPLTKIYEGIEVVAGDICNKKNCEQLCFEAKGGIVFHTIGIIHPKKVSTFLAFFIFLAALSILISLVLLSP